MQTCTYRLSLLKSLICRATPRCQSGHCTAGHYRNTFDDCLASMRTSSRSIPDAQFRRTAHGAGESRCACGFWKRRVQRRGVRCARCSSSCTTAGCLPWRHDPAFRSLCVARQYASARHLRWSASAVGTTLFHLVRSAAGVVSGPDQRRCEWTSARHSTSGSTLRKPDGPHWRDANRSVVPRFPVRQQSSLSGWQSRSRR